MVIKLPRNLSRFSREVPIAIGMGADHFELPSPSIFITHTLRYCVLNSPSADGLGGCASIFTPYTFKYRLLYSPFGGRGAFFYFVNIEYTKALTEVIEVRIPTNSPAVSLFLISNGFSGTMILEPGLTAG